MTIIQLLEKSVSTYLSPLLKKMHSEDVGSYEGLNSIEWLEVDVQETENELSKALILRLGISQSEKQLYLSNIFIPHIERNKGYGFGLINEIRNVAHVNGYELFIVDMVPSFYRRMISKGAIPVKEADDAVLVDEDTQLLSHRS
ncbi:hypothetical protein [Paenibacillus sp. FSL R5-0473]|uniref:hypothetical protein n=1 Tax=Paenibacillus sp. FSL R5-0473 TaxID=2921642 RepID=UPI0030F52153